MAAEQLAPGSFRVDLLTREYPPHIYGGAGVHVEELSKVLRQHLDVRVHCFDGPRTEPGVVGYTSPPVAEFGNPALVTFDVDLRMAAGTAGTDLVHSHTWYANLGGHLASLLHGVPHVLSAHSLEPLRPWKAEQLGGGYQLSSWAEKTAYEAAAGIIAVSAGMRQDILRAYPAVDPAKVHVVHNGIDLDKWRPIRGQAAADVARGYGIDPDQPTIVFVGRITRQKGLPYFLRALRQVDPAAQVVLCAGAPDTPEIAAEVRGLVAELQRSRGGVTWIEEMLPQPQLNAILSSASVFACPSIYEPLGIVNLEAMAAGIPVVATATGGIPEVVDDGVTGWLVPIEQVQDGSGTPLDADKFVGDLAAAFNQALSDPARLTRFGAAARERAVTNFSWDAIGLKTVDVYRRVLGG
ncbi:MAG: glycogen synthase [Bifidobacteriaceae bacterium]|jgi:starch synthase|nr:glycogen synthase [Bifidobacteriaceae bacterium]